MRESCNVVLGQETRLVAALQPATSGNVDVSVNLDVGGDGDGDVTAEAFGYFLQAIS